MNRESKRRLGQNGPEVFPIALGCMGMSPMYGPVDDRESTATIHEAIERGITLLDTGDFYGVGHNEMLLGSALNGRRDRVLLSVKFGALRGPGGEWTGVDTRPVAVKNFLAYTLTRLRVDYIDVYRPARLDPRVPIEDTVGAIADLVKAGYVRHIGLSEVGADTIRRAAAVHPISDLQIEYSLISRKPEENIFPVLRELGIGVTAYGVLSRGLLSGSVPKGKGDFRAHLPRFQEANRTKNDELVKALGDFAAAKHTTPTAIAIAYVMAKDAAVIPLVGARRRDQLAAAMDALSVDLSEADVNELERLVPADAVAGSRYDPAQMRMLDSEK